MKPDDYPDVTKPLASAPSVSSSELVRRLRSHIAMMAPHQKERHAGKLIIEAADAIEMLQRRVSEYQPYADAALTTMPPNK